MVENMSTVFKIILSSAVIGAVVTSFTNLFISMLNNGKLRIIEKTKHNYELIYFRYTKLYDILSKWTDLNSSFETEGKTVSQIAAERLTNDFISDHRKYEMMEPLLSNNYKKAIEEKYIEANALLKQLLDFETDSQYDSSTTLHKKHTQISSAFFQVAADYDKLLLDSLRLQLSELLSDL